MMFLALKRYAQFSGRSSPGEFWMFFLLQLIVYSVLFVITMVAIGGFSALSGASADSSATATGVMGIIATAGIFALLYLLVNLIFFIPNLAVANRRLHDTGRSGWWQLIYWVPFLLYITLAVIGAGAQSSGLTAMALVMSLLQLIGLLVLIVFYVMPGTPGPNQYGPSPLGMGATPQMMGGRPGYPPQQGYAPQGYPQQGGGYPPQGGYPPR